MLARFRFAGSANSLFAQQIIERDLLPEVVTKWMPSSGTMGTSLWQTAPSRNAATKAPKDSTQASKDSAQADFLEKYMNIDNMVRERFVQIGKMYESFFDAQRDIEVPLDGDESKIKKYHNQLLKLRKSFDIPDKVEIMQTLMKEKKASSRGLVRKWVKDLEDTWGEALYESMMRIVSDVEGETKEPLHFPTKENPDPAGWSLFKQKHQELMQEHGLEKPLTKDQILYEDTKHGLEQTVDHVQNGVDDLREKLGITEKFDARKVRTTLTRDVE